MQSREHGFDSAPFRFVCLEHSFVSPQVAAKVATVPSRQRIAGVGSRIPRCRPPHEVAVSDNLVNRTAAKDGVGYVAVSEVGLDGRSHCSLAVRAPFALLLVGGAVVPHEVIGHQHTPVFENLMQRHGTILAYHSDRIHRRHRQSPPSGSDFVSLTHVCFFADQQFRAGLLPLISAHDFGGWRFSHCIVLFSVIGSKTVFAP